MVVHDLRQHNAKQYLYQLLAKQRIQPPLIWTRDSHRVWDERAVAANDVLVAVLVAREVHRQLSAKPRVRSDVTRSVHAAVPVCCAS
eukprot:6212773-Pleurochrysis_carterae.AAC.2